MSGYVPNKNSASSLRIYLGFIATGVVTSGHLLAFTAGSAADHGLIYDMQGAPLFLLYGGGGGKSWWTTVSSINTNGPTFSLEMTDIPPFGIPSDGQAIIFLEISKTGFGVPSAPGGNAGGPVPTIIDASDYIGMGSIDFESSLSTRPTLNFDLISIAGPLFPTQTFLPLLGMPVLLIDDTYGWQFGGSIDQIQIQNYPGRQATIAKCQCVSWDQILQRRLLMLTGAYAVGSNTDTFIGDGTTTAWNLSHEPSALVKVTVDGVNKTFGPYGSSANFWWLLDTLPVQVNPNDPTVPSGKALVVQYDAPGFSVNTPIFVNQTALQIVSQLTALCEDDGVSLSSSAVTGPTVSSIGYTTQDTVASALSSLISFISDGTTNYWYYVDPQKVLYFEEQGITRTAPWNVSESDGSDGNVLMQVSVTKSRDQFANAAWADIGLAVGSSYAADGWLGNGSSRSFQTTYGIDSVYTPAGGCVLFPGTGGYIVQTCGVTGTGTYDWYFDIGGTTLTQDASGTTLTSTQELELFYIPTLTVTQQYYNSVSIVDRQAVEGGSGEWDLYVNLGNTNPVLASATPAQNQATYYAAVSEVLEFTTYRGGLVSGQAITVNLPLIGAVGTYVVDQVKLTDEDNLAKWTVSCNAGAVVGNWRQALRRVANLLV